MALRSMNPNLISQQILQPRVIDLLPQPSPPVSAPLLAAPPVAALLAAAPLHIRLPCSITDLNPPSETTLGANWHPRSMLHGAVSYKA